ncbi:MAG: SDR family NAD(P)-dependent oxidoreductase [Bdellovibrionales bacterium]|nr:SDR family NAD(P)-dependent oxidoreductase [Bdellovibrionales bacterium]
MIKGSRVLITGGTGSLGKELVRQLLDAGSRVVVYSRNEERQYELQQEHRHTSLELKIGDVRDTATLSDALRGCDFAIHAAAMKDVIFCERQPTQCVFNNIDGSRSFIEAVKRSKVKKAVGVSTDKAAAPSNVYGASKYIMEKMFEEANRYSETTFSSVRFGNMIDSRGSLVSAWKQNPQGEIKLTHPEVARFFFSVAEAAETTLHALEVARGGEVYIRKMKKARIKDVLAVITGKNEFEIMGLFPGEKIHEDLVSQNEVGYCWEHDSYFSITPDQPNPTPPPMFNTENAAAFSLDELRKLIFPERNGKV